MNVECKDRDRVLEEQRPEEMKALAEHAAHCATCTEELRWWNEISSAARTMQKSWETPYLWPKIRRALEAEMEAGTHPQRWSFAGFGEIFGMQWQTVAAALVVIILLASGTWMALRSPRGPLEKTPVAQDKHFLDDQAVRKVEEAEAAYVKAIDNLAAVAAPKIDHPTTALMASYREKLLLLDAAIADCRANIEKNRANASLREDLLSMYQEKERTLKEVLRED